MIGKPGRLLRLLVLTTALALTGSACSGGGGGSEEAQEGATETTATVPKGPTTPAAAVRGALANLLGEHTMLATGAIGAALAQRDAEFAAAKTQLDANSDGLTELLTAIFGPEAGKAFDPLWKKHIDLFVQYGQGSSAAAGQLIEYTKEFGAFIHSVLPEVPAETVAKLVEEHVLGLKAVVDAMKGDDFAKAYADLRSAYAHMDAIAKPLSTAIAKAFPDKVSGDPTSPAVELLVTLNKVLGEHAYLVGLTTGAIAGGRTPEVAGASAALDANSKSVTAAIASVYGGDVGSAFDPLWKKHIGFLVTYTEAKAAKDSAKADAAVDDLMAYAKEFGAFIHSGSPELTKDSVAGLITTHIFTLKDMVDNQAAGNLGRAWEGFRESGSHMGMIAIPLTDTLVAQFPKKF